jgi:hypothetical protein
VIDGRALASAQVMRNWTAAALALAVVGLAVPSAAAAQATLSVDPGATCYREQSGVLLQGKGFTPNGNVVFSRDGNPLGEPIQADGAGGLQPQLILPGLVRGQSELTYRATDQTNTALSAQVSLLVTATDVVLKPSGGPPNRLLTIRARGFIREGAHTLYAHVVRVGKRPGKPRNIRIAKIDGACGKATARMRLFTKKTAAGRYRVQFDTFRRYSAGRTVKSNFSVTVYRRAGTARASGLSPAS